MQRTWGRHSTLELQIPAPPPSSSRRTLFAAMSLQPSRAALISSPSRSLCALLALLLLTPPPGSLASAGPVAVVQRELRCVCLTLTSSIHPKMISNLQVIPEGPHCPSVQVIVTLRTNKEICLDPEAPLFKKIIRKFLNSGNKKN